MDNANTHGKIIEFEYESGEKARAFIDGVPDKCDHVWGGEGWLLISPTRDNELGWSYKIKESEIQRMYPDKELNMAIMNYDMDLRTGGHYIGGSCTSCKKCGKPYTPPFW